DPDPLMTGTITPSNGLFSQTWQNMYEGIHRANDAIINIPSKSPVANDVKARLVAECKFLRAYFYYRLNQVYDGVPVYLEPVEPEEANRPRATGDSVWRVVLKDLTDCINEPSLPGRYPPLNAAYGRVTKGAAYALRGKVYMYMRDWASAAADFRQVEPFGFALNPNYRALFTEAQEQSPEMIFSIQNIGISGLGSTTQFFCGTRASFGSCWNTYMVSPNLVDLYDNADGSRFNWDVIIPGYSSMSPARREVFFLRNNITAAERTAAVNRGLDMSLYLPTGNEQRIAAAYANRDPRLNHNVIVPYSTYLGRPLQGVDQTFVSRWPYRTFNIPTLDLQTDTSPFFYYLYRKFVYEGSTQLLNRSFGPIDMPLIRFADVLLNLAECEVEMGNLSTALQLVNRVRTRAGVGNLQTANPAAPGYVDNTTTAVRDRVRDERRVEFPNEGINYFDEIRWGTWKEKVFAAGSGVKQIWGTNVHTYTWRAR
ncbi:MAG: RagB/SusD family nutrient uptake outer membrane protein, partial [Chitinophagaceae bacterium]|nr:RagB/SusD family nutrient uptake outer membrane protein [Chitinophagaceae bacterium]